jgi:CheY-like chemotaxis protein
MRTSQTDNSRGDRKCVLIVDDDRMHASALRSIFTRKGCDVAVAVSVSDGIAQLASRPDYVVLDLMLPDGDGVEILARVRAQEAPVPPAAATRVVVATGVNDPHKLREVLALQPHRLLNKPLDLVDLLRAIDMM